MLSRSHGPSPRRTVPSSSTSGHSRPGSSVGRWMIHPASQGHVPWSRMLAITPCHTCPISDHPDKIPLLVRIPSNLVHLWGGLAVHCLVRLVTVWLPIRPEMAVYTSFLSHPWYVLYEDNRDVQGLMVVASSSVKYGRHGVLEGSVYSCPQGSISSSVCGMQRAPRDVLARYNAPRH